MNLQSIPNGQFVLNAGYALIFIGVFMVTRMLMQEQESRAAQENLEDKPLRSGNPLVRITRVFFRPYLVPVVRGKRFWDNQRKIYKRKIISGGLKDELTPDEFIAFKLVLILFFPIVFGVLKSLEFIDFSNWYAAASAVAGWFYPDIWVNSRIKARQKQILKAMPFIIDLLALSTEAGLDFLGAIGKVVDKAAPSPLVDEFAQLMKEIKVGSSRGDALREMSLRIDMSEMNSFVAILISADQMGAPIGKILRQQSEQIRTERMLRAEKAGAAAASKVMMPTILFIMPAVILMVLGPFLLALIYPGK